MQREPQHGNHGDRVVDLVALDHGVGFGERQDLDQDVLMLVGQAEYAAGLRSVDPTQEDSAGLRARPRRQHQVLDREQLVD